MPSQEITDNPMINKLKQHLLNELYTIIEFVLLNSTSQTKPLPKDRIQARLLSLANATDAKQSNITSLRIIDSYLNDKNTENLVKEAI